MFHPVQLQPFVSKRFQYLFLHAGLLLVYLTKHFINDSSTGGMDSVRNTEGLLPVTISPSSKYVAHRHFNASKHAVEAYIVLCYGFPRYRNPCCLTTPMNIAHILLTLIHNIHCMHICINASHILQTNHSVKSS